MDLAHEVHELFLRELIPTHSVLVAMTCKWMRDVVRCLYRRLHPNDPARFRTNLVLLQDQTVWDWAQKIKLRPVHDISAFQPDFQDWKWDNPADSECRLLAQHQILPGLKWARKGGNKFNCIVMQIVARTCNHEILAWIHVPGLVDTHLVCNAVAGRGDLPLLQWAIAHGYPVSYTVYNEAAENGHRHVVEWLRSKGYQWTNTATAYASLGGHLPLLIWMCSQGCLCDHRVCHSAIVRGHLDILLWAREHDLPWTFIMARRAVQSPHEHIVRWAITNGDEIDASTAAAAAGHGNLPLLQWLVEIKQCPLSHSMWAKAIQNGHLHVMKWAYSIGVTKDTDHILIAHAYGQLDLLAWLQSVITIE